MIDPRKAALIIIDMQHGFLDSSSALCVAGAAATVPACTRALNRAREPVSRACASPRTLDEYEPLAPQPGDRVIVKPRFSAFFATQLDLVLRRLGVGTVVLIGTTTPNCIRTTCYDAIALEYNTVVLTDCCSSHTEEIQRVNLEDMARAGAILMDSASFADYGPGTVEDLSAAIRKTDALRTTAEGVFLFRVIPSGSGCAGWRSRRRSGRRAPRTAGSADRPAADPPPASGR